MGYRMASKRAKIPLHIVRGNTLNPFFIWSTGSCNTALTPVDLTGASARLQVRDPATGDLLLEMSTAAGSIILNEAPGKVRYLLTPAQTAALNWTGEAQYDLEFTFADGTVTNKVFGPATLETTVTQ